MSKTTTPQNDETNTALPVTQSNADFYRSLGMGALDDLSSKDIIMPRYKLVQNTSHQGTPGKWISNLSPEQELEELRIIILSISNYQTLFPDPGQGDRPLCRSNDGYSKTDAAGVGDGSCDTCRYNVWGRDDRGKGIPPKCKSGYTILGLITLADGTIEPGMVSLKGTAIRPAKQYFTRMRARGIPPFAYVTVLTSVSDHNEKGRFFKPVLEFGEDLSRDEATYAAKQARAFRDYLSPDVMIDDTRETRDYDETAHSSQTQSPGMAAFLQNSGTQPVPEVDMNIGF